MMKTEPPEPKIQTGLMHAYQEKLQALLDHIKENNTLSLRDRVSLLDAHVDEVKASLREARSFVRTEERVVSVAL
ncbi:MAG: hypothetical protein ACR2OE_04195, partial [Thermomicrobiales bacterium]